MRPQRQRVRCCARYGLTVAGIVSLMGATVGQSQAPSKASLPKKGAPDQPVPAAEPGIAFADTGSLKLTIGDLRSVGGVSVVIVNTGNSDAPIIGSIVEQGRSADGAFRLSDLRLVPESVSVPAHGAASIALRWPANGIAGPASVRGRIRIVSGAQVRYRAVRLDLALPLLASAWSVRAIRWWPLPPRPTTITDGTDAMPLDTTADTAAIHQGLPSPPSVLFNADSGHSITARVSGVTTSGPTTRALRLEFGALAYTGRYIGRLAVPFGDSVTVRLRVTDFFLWPVLALTIGLGLALLTQWYFGVQRPTWDLRVRIFSLTGELAAAQRTFRELAPPAASNLSIEHDFSAQQRELTARVTNAPRPIFATWDSTDPTYASLLTTVQMLETQARDWAAWGADLKHLSDAIAVLVALKDHAPAPGNWPDGLPAAVNDAHTLLSGGELTLQDFAAQKKQVALLTPLLQRLHDLIHRVIRDNEWITGIPAAQLPDAICVSSTGVKGIEAVLRLVHFDLWDIRTADDLTARQSETALALVEHCLASTPPLAAAGKRSARHIVPMLAAESLARKELVASQRARPVTDAENAANYKRSIKDIDWLVTAVAWAIAMVAWLKTSYLGQPFGSLADYLGALTWGFGTKVGLEALLATVNKLRTTGIPFVTGKSTI